MDTDTKICENCGEQMYRCLGEIFGATGSLRSRTEWRHDRTERIYCAKPVPHKTVLLATVGTAPIVAGIIAALSGIRDTHGAGMASTYARLIIADAERYVLENEEATADEG